MSFDATSNRNIAIRLQNRAISTARSCNKQNDLSDILLYDIQKVSTTIII